MKKIINFIFGQRKDPIQVILEYCKHNEYEVKYNFFGGLQIIDNISMPELKQIIKHVEKNKLSMCLDGGTLTIFKYDPQWVK